MGIVLAKFGGNDPLDAVERISGLFTASLGFVWGHYFGKKGAESLARIARNQLQETQQALDRAKDRVRELESEFGKR